MIYAYLRVSTDHQAGDGHGLDAQRAAIEHEAEYREWDVTYIEEAASAVSLDRIELNWILGDLGDGDTLVVAKLDRLSRSVVDFGNLLAMSKARGWNIVALDFGMDTTTPNGKLVANILMSVAEWERETIAQRTKEGMAAAKAKGVRFGPESPLPDKTRTEIVKLSSAGNGNASIARHLTGLGIPTAGGKLVWSASQVRRVLIREGA